MSEAVREAILKLVQNESLGEQQAEEAMVEIVTGRASPAQVAAFLTALRMKGETVDELIGSARAMRKGVTRVSPRRKDLVDISGTGDDRAGHLTSPQRRGWWQQAQGWPLPSMATAPFPVGVAAQTCWRP